MKNIYAEKALEEIPRLLSCLDRNPFSPSYGCFNREYWLTRTRDFPDAIAQFGTLSLALVWSFEFPGGQQYYKNPEIKKWIEASIRYWIKIQHSDGSFDEFYPNERGWAGPTGFLLYSMLRSYEVMENEFPNELKELFFKAVKKSAWFLATREEPGVLANHHAMALLPVYQSYHHLKKIDAEFANQLRSHFNDRMKSFLSYCDPEGWSLEYDGADPGYLSATVSFLSKMQRYMDGTESWKGDVDGVIKRAISFCSYFFYPNGSYGGTLGSRQTLHFYAHGFELQSPSNSLAAALGDFGRQSLAEGKLVPPGIQDDRYYLYRIPELLEAYIDSPSTPAQGTEMVAFQRAPFEQHFEHAKFYIKNTNNHYLLLNLAKGGVLKIYDKKTRALVFSDDGMVAQLEKGSRLTTQWIGEEYVIQQTGNDWSVTGNFHAIPYKYFNPITMIAFRAFMILTGWNAHVAEWIKGVIRNLLMTKASTSSIQFERHFSFQDTEISIRNVIRSQKSIATLRIGGQFASRYVPQSRYFQHEELQNPYVTVLRPPLSHSFNTTFTLSGNNISNSS